jgi:hypothetical protein
LRRGVEEKKGRMRLQRTRPKKKGFVALTTMPSKHELPPKDKPHSMPWPIPEQGADIEVVSYRREPTENKNAKERLFFVRLRVVPGELRYIELRSYWRERDVVTKRESYDSGVVCGEADVEIVSKGRRLGWLGPWFVDAKEMKGRKPPATLEKVFTDILERVRQFALCHEARYRSARAANEQREWA